jgi:Asp-tRNA(Asn)/Glu-tRNA(Gln) amidotransferase A subunit family amidase
LAEAAQQIRRGALSPSELVESCLGRIAAREPELHAWVTLDEAGARVAARRAGEQAEAAEALLLLGIPFGVKDNFTTADLPTSAGFPGFAARAPRRDATAVARLRVVGGIVLGKTVTTQFAMGSWSETRNPWDLSRTPGGSSSGSGAAVAARMVPLALGSQTGGSVLRPASYSGVVGFKPTFGRISREGVIPLAWSFDHVGIIARTVEDAALALQAMGGHDPLDPVSSRRPVPDFGEALTGGGRPPRLGLVLDLVEAAEPAVRANVEDAVRRLTGAGAEVSEVRLPAELALLLAIHGLILRVEGSTVHRALHAEQAEGYVPAICASIEVGQLIPAAVYLHAQRLRRRVRAAVVELLRGYDAFLCPTVSNVAPDARTTGDARFQSVWTLFGLPALTLPSGLSAEGLPFGAQLIGPAFAELDLLATASWCERVLGPLPPPAFRQAYPDR